MEYRKVLSANSIAIRFADVLEDNRQLSSLERSSFISRTAGLLNGTDTAAKTVLFHLEKTGGKAQLLIPEVVQFRQQKELVKQPYTKTGDTQYDYEFECADTDDIPTKIITQEIYDDAVKNGFPVDFFHLAYFERIDIYCMPENANCQQTHFANCRFVACAARGADFTGSKIYDCNFETADLRNANFSHTTIAHTHFHYCNMENVNLQAATFRGGIIAHCNMQRADMTNTQIYSFNFGEVKAEGVKGFQRSNCYEAAGTPVENERYRQQVGRIFNQRPKCNTHER